MTDHPILFSAPTIRALLAGRKTETRRIIKPQPKVFYVTEDGVKRPADVGAERDEDGTLRIRIGRVITAQKLRWKPGDRLWAREAWAKVGDNEDDIHACPDLTVHAYYRADAVQPECLRWRPSIHMPRWASRITLLVDDVRVERVQDITEEGADREGFGGDYPARVFPEFFGDDAGSLTIPECFGVLWSAINGPKSWTENPWVTVTRFRVVLSNIDRVTP